MKVIPKVDGLIPPTFSGSLRIPVGAAHWSVPPGARVACTGHDQTELVHVLDADELHVLMEREGAVHEVVVSFLTKVQILEFLFPETT